MFCQYLSIEVWIIPTINTRWPAAWLCHKIFYTILKFSVLISSLVITQPSITIMKTVISDQESWCILYHYSDSNTTSISTQSKYLLSKVFLTQIQAGPLIWLISNSYNILFFVFQLKFLIMKNFYLWNQGNVTNVDWLVLIG